MQVRFDEPDAMVIDDIPEDTIALLERNAAAAGLSVEDYIRKAVIGHFAQLSNRPE